MSFSWLIGLATTTIKEFLSRTSRVWACEPSCTKYITQPNMFEIYILIPFFRFSYDLPTLSFFYFQPTHHQNIHNFVWLCCNMNGVVASGLTRSNTSATSKRSQLEVKSLQLAPATSQAGKSAIAPSPHIVEDFSLNLPKVFSTWHLAQKQITVWCLLSHRASGIASTNLFHRSGRRLIK